jgi:hypothetical protein
MSARRSTDPTARRRARGDDGLANALIIITMTVVMLLAAGLACDGGRVLAARREAVDVAAQAARAGAQATSIETLRAGQVHVDAAAAVTAAGRFLAATGHRGDAAVEGDEVVVKVSISVALPLLSSAGVRSTTVTGRGAAHVVRGIWKADP